MSSYATNSTANIKQTIDKKVLFAIVGFLIAAIIGACAAQGYENYGQCVKVWAHSKGYGYGG
jgi:hypothetical protein